MQPMLYKTGPISVWEPPRWNKAVPTVLFAFAIIRYPVLAISAPLASPTEDNKGNNGAVVVSIQREPYVKPRGDAPLQRYGYLWSF